MHSSSTKAQLIESTYYPHKCTVYENVDYPHLLRDLKKVWIFQSLTHGTY